MVERRDIHLEITNLNDVIGIGKLNIARIELDDDKDNPVIYWIREGKLYKGRIVKIPDIKLFMRALPKKNGDGDLRQFTTKDSDIVLEFLDARNVNQEDYLIANPEGYWGYTKDVVDITDEALGVFAYNRASEVRQRLAKPIMDGNIH